VTSLGGGGIRPPFGPRISDSHASRLDALENKRALNTRPEVVRFELGWAWSSTVTASKSPGLPARYSARLKEVKFLLITAGSSDSTFKVYLSGAALTPLAVDSNMSVASTTLTLTSGNNTGLAQFDDLFSKEDYLQIEVVSAGTGAADLTATGRFG
jgi:hypothetical protein